MHIIQMVKLYESSKNWGNIVEKHNLVFDESLKVFWKFGNLNNEFTLKRKTEENERSNVVHEERFENDDETSQDQELEHSNTDEDFSV